MAAPVLLKSGKATTASVTISTWGTTVAAGDMLVLGVMFNGTPMASPPSGWTAGPGTDNFRSYRKVATGSETSVTITLSPADRGSQYWLAKIPAAELDGTTPYDTASAASQASGGGAYATPSVTPSAGDKLAIVFFGDAKDTGGGAASYSGWTDGVTEVFDDWAASTNPPSNYTLSLGVGTKELTGGSAVSFGVTQSSGTVLARIGAILIFNKAGAPADTTAPTNPTSLAQTGATTGSVTVGWTASTDNVAVTGYDRRIDGGTPETNIAGTTATFSGLSAGTTHTVEVRARDAAGNTSSWVSVSATTSSAPSEPSAYRPRKSTRLAEGHNGVQQVTTVTHAAASAGDLLVLVMTCDDALLPDTGNPQPEDSGYTYLGGFVEPTTEAGMHFWYKVADGGETSVVFSVKDEADPPPAPDIKHSGAVYTLMSFEGANPDDPIDDFQVVSAFTPDVASGGITWATPTVIASEGKKIAVAGFLDFKQTNGGASTISGYGSGWVERSDIYGLPSIGSVFMMNQSIITQDIDGGASVGTTASYLTTPNRLGAASFMLVLNAQEEPTGGGGEPGTGVPHPHGIVGRHFVDQYGTPVLLSGDTPWYIAGGNPADWATYLANRKAYGVNLVHLACLPRFDAVDPTTWDGTNIHGLTTPGNYSTVNTAWVNRVKAFVEAAAEYGITVMFLVGPANVISSESQATAWGTAWGNALKGYSNLLWSFGVDWSPAEWTAGTTILAAVLAAVRATGAAQPHTLQVHYTYTSTDVPTWGPGGANEVDFGGTYNYNEVSSDSRRAYAASTFPIIFLEGNYEGENHQGGPDTTAETHRRTVGWALTCGSVGAQYGKLGVYNPVQDGTTASWTSILASNYLAHQKVLFDALGATAWWKLVPVTGTAFVKTGNGTLPTSGTQDGARVDPLESTLATAAVDPDKTLAVVYLPTSRAITIDLTKLGVIQEAYKIDPTNGTKTSISKTGTIAAPGNNAAGQSDWLYVFKATVGNGPRIVKNGVEKTSTLTVVKDGLESPASMILVKDGVEKVLL